MSPHFNYIWFSLLTVLENQYYNVCSKATTRTCYIFNGHTIIKIVR